MVTQKASRYHYYLDYLLSPITEFPFLYHAFLFSEHSK